MGKELLRNIYLGIHEVFDLSVKNLSKALMDFGITPAQLGVLKNIPQDGARTMTDLFQIVGCAPSNMTSIIRRMERDDLVNTFRNPQDQRETLVRLTKKGMDLLDSIEPAYQTFLQESYSHLSPDEMQTLIELLSKLKEGLT